MALKCEKTSHCPLQYKSRESALPTPASRDLRRSSVSERWATGRAADARDDGDKFGRPVDFAFSLARLRPSRERVLPPRLCRVTDDTPLLRRDVLFARNEEDVRFGDAREGDERVARRAVVRGRR